jgi:glutathione peroxidase
MKKIIPCLVIILFIFENVFAQSLYSIAINDVSGNSAAMQSLARKKTMFIVLPVEVNDPLHKQLISFSDQYGDTINIVGILSVEDGHQKNSNEAIKNLYAQTRVLLTEPMHVRKLSASKQSELLQWLTDRNKNHHSDRDAAHTGMKFFVDETGRLYAVMSNVTGLQSPIISRIVHSPAIRQKQQ